MAQNALRLSPSVLLQVAGVIAGYLTIVVIARKQGPAVQGEFAILKSFVDSVIVLVLLGIPQAVVLSLNQKQTAIRVILRHLPSYAIAVACISSIAAFFILPQQLDQHYSSSVLIAVVFATTGYALFAVVRATLLTVTEGAAFAFFTAVPQLLLFMSVAIIVASNTSKIHWAFLYQGLLTLVCSAVVASTLWNRDRSVIEKLPAARKFMSENLHAFAQATLYTGQYFVIIFFLGRFSDDLTLAGIWSVAVLPVQVIQGLAGVVGPYFYNRASKVENDLSIGLVTQQLLIVACAVQMLATIPLLTFPSLVGHAFGIGFKDVSLPLTVMSCAVFPCIITRAISPFLQTSGFAFANTSSCILRFCSGCALAFLALKLDQSVFGLALAWLVSEWLACSWVLFCVFQRRRS